MRITLREIEAFAAVCTHNSFKDAAAELSISPPALTRRVQKLEDMLGVTLLNRTTRTVEPTPTGLEFFRRTKAVMEDLEVAVMTFQEGSEQRARVVNIACITTATQYFLPEVIEAFYERFPRVRVRILDSSAADCLAAVLNGEADFGVSFSGAGEPGIHFTALQQDPFVLACSRNHVLASRESVRWSELAEHRYIAAYKGGSSNRLLIDTSLAEKGFQVPWFYEVRHTATSLSLAERGLGVAALPRSALPKGRHPTLAVIPLIDPVIHRGVGVVRRQGVHFSTATQSLFDLLIAQWGTSKVG